MRGKGKPILSVCCRVGITPAYAGKSTAKPLRCRFDVGSPPPMRGKAFFNAAGMGIPRITPAYAGKR